MTQSMRRHVLDGYKVLDFTHYVAGPTVTRLMAEMGAEIIKIEAAPHGDQGRLVPYVRDKRSAYFVQQNRGKQSVCVDLRKPKGIEIVKALVPEVDVLVENFAPGVIARMGLAYEDVRRSIRRSSCVRFPPSGRRDRSRKTRDSISSARLMPE
jgi:crotonobetainyl-CoA:carnitine CoA-transferase CaiB-like acyl-CoA transferase